jgi:hypothetical protein
MFGDTLSKRSFNMSGKIGLQNMGTWDRILRLIIAAVIVVLSISGKISGTLEIVLLVLAAVFVVTSVVRICPLYMPFGIDTCKK